MRTEKRPILKDGRTYYCKFHLNQETGVEQNHGDWAKELGLSAASLSGYLKTYSIEEMCRGEYLRKGCKQAPYRPRPDILTKPWRTFSNQELRITPKQFGVPV